MMLVQVNCSGAIRGGLARSQILGHRARLSIAMAWSWIGEQDFA